MPDVTFTVDGKKLTAPAGTLLIDACRKAGIEIPAFCYYPGLSLQAACRMCVVRQEKVPKLQTACTTTVAEGQVFITESPEIAQARKATIELLLGNHPLDCPVCDAGGECELQDMTFKYGAGESLYAEAKHHRDEQQWSPAVFYDRPRCILCYRCIRMCGEGMDVWALGIQNRGADSVIVPNDGNQLDCEQCGMCIDVCPVGALTSGSYRYKTRPWEMNHVSTVCTHCADGCKVTLGVRSTNDGAEIIRADNRDKSGINNDFLCAKGRFGFRLRRQPRSAHPAARPQLRRQARARYLGTRTPPRRVQAQRDSRRSRRRSHRRHRLQSHHQRRKLPAAEIRAHGSRTPTTSITSAPRTTQPSPAPSPVTPAKLPACATSLLPAPSCSSAAIPLTNIRSSPGCFARCPPQSRAPLRRQLRAHQARRARPKPPLSSSRRHTKLSPLLSVRGETDFSKALLGRRIAHRHLWRRDSRQGNRGSRRLGHRGAVTSVSPALAITRIRAAQPTWVSSLICCPAMYPSLRRALSLNIPICPPRPAKPCRKCLKPPATGDLGALLVVGANPVSRAKLNPAALQNTFLVVAGSLPH